MMNVTKMQSSQIRVHPMITRSETYVLSEPHGWDVVEQLAPERLIPVSEVEKTVRYFDTFDWRLYRKGLALIQGGNAVYLQRVSDGEYPPDARSDRDEVLRFGRTLLVDVSRGRVARHIAGRALGSGVITSSAGAAEGLRIWRFECR